MSYLLASGLTHLDYDTRSLAEANIRRYHAIRLEPCEREDHRRKLWGLRSTYLHHATKLAHDGKLSSLELWYHFFGVSYRNTGIRLTSSWRPVSWPLHEHDISVLEYPRGGALPAVLRNVPSRLLAMVRG
jgi:hypothetical protein